MRSYERSDQAEIQQRVDALINLSAMGFSTSVLIKKAREKWNVSYRQAKRYVQRAKEQEKKLGTRSAEELLSQALQMTQHIYQVGLHTQNHEISRKVASDFLKLSANMKKDPTNVASKTYQSGLIKPDELEDVIRSLEQEGENQPK